MCTHLDAPLSYSPHLAPALYTSGFGGPFNSRHVRQRCWPAARQTPGSQRPAPAADLLPAPFRYEDRSDVKPLDELAPGEMATVLATVRSAHLPRFRRRSLRMIEVFTDPRGSRLVGKGSTPPA